ncbi:MAG: hypothetical protein LWW81_01655, partial [Rhodocyclales bacterium]|nr:hypothetical protein [Rhodocyclales bacterium]
MKPPFFVLREGGFSLAGGALLGAHGAGVAAGFTPLPLRERLDEGWVSVAPQGLLGWQPLCFTAAFRLKASYFLLLACIDRTHGEHTYAEMVNGLCIAGRAVTKIQTHQFVMSEIDIEDTICILARTNR